MTGSSTPRDWMAFYGSGATGAAIFGSVYGYISARYVDLPPTIGKEAFKKRLSTAGYMQIISGSVVQLVLLSTIYTGGAFAAATLRSKDDIYNDGIGGALTGAFIGLRRPHQVHSAVLFGAGGAALAILNSYSFKNCKKLFEEGKNPFAKY